jgi:DNA-damage-inducible protein D
MNTELNNFEEIKHFSDNGAEYWSARELQKPLGYEKWDNFSKVIDKAMLACNVAGFDVAEHFPAFGKMIEMPSNSATESTPTGFPDVGKTKKIIDYRLSRYACYLVVR